jgi:3-hydroxyacyl-CoA dehydrogenase / enoyl-CoA hydratase / 3-hydroxybutyryl-CoA epimerase
MHIPEEPWTMTTYTNFKLDVDADGIATIVWDMPGKTMNVIDIAVTDEMDAIVTRVLEDPAIKGAIFTSAKDSFGAGADLNMLENLNVTYRALLATKGEEAAAKAVYDESSRISRVIRRAEAGGKPWVAAINGTALGGCFEITLACHYRIAGQNPRTRLGLPEVKVGVFPGGGGTQRIARMMNTQDALQFLFKGDQHTIERAKAMKLIDAIVPMDEMIPAAKAWIKAGVWPKNEKGLIAAPWDLKDFKGPGGKVYSPGGMMTWPPANAIYRRETYDNYPAARAILQTVYEGLQLPMDLALRIESRWFANVLRTPQAAAMIRSLFVSMQALNKGIKRPSGPARTKLTKVGVVGAGFMGAGIAYVTAAAGMDVVLIDRDIEAATKGKAYSEKLMTDRVQKGRATPAERDAVLAKITPSADYAALGDVDLVIEAVFEDRKIKDAVIKQIAANVKPGVMIASNTSTLPITSLADYSPRPVEFVGIHFFSPVEKMLLVEIIRGEKTGDGAVAAAMDYVKAIKKTPIVVNDSRGFYANRCVGNYILEGHLMLMEGVPPAMIENAAKMAGMPVGPLSLNDEVAIDLALKVMNATKADLGKEAVHPMQEKLLTFMVEQKGRLGRKNGKGFYEYPDKGQPKFLWAGLAEVVGKQLKPADVDVQELKHRLLVTQALEAARTVEDGVVTDPREADVGSILGFGFAPWSGGTLSYIDFMGPAKFVELCKALEKKHGPRFKVGKQLAGMAKSGETFYGLMLGKAAQAAE